MVTRLRRIGGGFRLGVKGLVAKFLFAFCPLSLGASIVLFFVLGVHYWFIYAFCFCGFGSFLVGRRLEKGKRPDEEA